MNYSMKRVVLTASAIRDPETGEFGIEADNVC